MQKVILAILAVAVRENATADVSIATAGARLLSEKAKLGNLGTGESFSIHNVDSGTLVGTIQVMPDQANRAQVNLHDGKYAIEIGGLSIDFAEPFQGDPFAAVNTTARPFN